MSSGLHRRSTVCALIPHYECEAWLGQAIESLLEQTRPVDGVVVMDDGSAVPPIDIVQRYPGVTLLAAPDNGGPYRLVQAVIESTDFDAYLFQDADDWSARDRVQVLLDRAEDTGAELVGSHEVRLVVDQADMQPVRYPLDVNAALAGKPTAYPLLHPTSLVSRDLVQRLGGFASGMRFSGDAEFLRRAAHEARVVNADHFGYFRRKRAGSLTTAAATGLASEARREVQADLADRAIRNADAVRRGEEPDLRPRARVALPRLRRLVGDGPRPQGAPVAHPAPRPTATATSGQDEDSPVFVIGPPRAGERLLEWSLAQHPRLRSMPEPAWLARTALDAVRVAQQEPPPAPEYLERVAHALLITAGSAGHRLVASGGLVTEFAWALAQTFPRARFIHVHRSAQESVAALLGSPTEGAVFYTPELALRRWIATSRTAFDLRTALGSDRVVRVRYEELLARPEQELRRVLGHLGLPHDAACARPLSGLETAPAADALDLTAMLHQQAAELAEHADQSGRSDDVTRAAAVARLGRTLVRHDAPVSTLVDKVRAAVARTVPEGTAVVVVSRGDEQLVDLHGATGWHLPQGEGGVYAGHHPGNSGEIVDQLEELRSAGAEYLVVPASSLWWLTYYAGLRTHIDRKYRLVSYQEDACAIYRLNADSPDPAEMAPRWVVQDDRTAS